MRSGTVRLSIFVSLVAAAAVACAGCYDGHALVETARSTAVKSRLAEMDFGTFQTTLPREDEPGVVTELKVRVFGMVPRYRVPEIKKQLKVDEYRLRAETLAAVRKATRAELAEPNLVQLRDRIQKVVNGILTEAPVKTIGFYEVAFRHK